MSHSAPDPEEVASSTASGPSRWLLIALVALGIAALAFAIGRFSTFGAGGGVTLPGTTSAEAGFARDMQVHHAQAVDMAMEIYRKTDDQELQIFAYDLATTQAAQKGEMFDWLVKWGLPQSGEPMMAWMAGTDAGHDHGLTGEELTDDEIRDAMGMASEESLSTLRDSTGTGADCLFLDLMIRHHQGAIPMAEALLELGRDERALAVAESIEVGQSAEIDLMQSMQSRFACTL